MVTESFAQSPHPIFHLTRSADGPLRPPETVEHQLCPWEVESMAPSQSGSGALVLWRAYARSPESGPPSEQGACADRKADQ